jgi:serine phosphatase RsbU (regulator of sigma subunit)
MNSTISTEYYKTQGDPNSRKSRLLLNFLKITSLFSLLYVLVSILIEYTPGVVSMLINFVFFVLVLALYFKEKINYSTAAHLYIFNSCFVAVFICTFFSGGILSPVLPWFTLIPVIALLLFGRTRKAYFWVGISIACVSSLSLFAFTGYQFPSSYNPNFLHIFTFTCIIGLIIIIFILTKIFEQEKDRAMLVIKEKNNEILDSIYYAQRIQQAILPPISFVKNNFENSFVFFKPKDIVAGDFYWVESKKIDDNYRFNETDYLADAKNSIILFAAADCTGHGVPGAMVSVICSNALKRATHEFHLTQPAMILDKVRDIVMEQFFVSENEVKDGMDIALCSFNTKTLELEFSGANNPLWIVRKDAQEVEIIKGDRQPIGNFTNPTPFTNHRVQLNKGDIIYLFTDGFQDQFGGEKGKKYMIKNLKTFFLRIAHLPIPEQKQKLTEEFSAWKGTNEQIDDLCIIGIQI